MSSDSSEKQATWSAHGRHAVPRDLPGPSAWEAPGKGSLVQYASRCVGSLVLLAIGPQNPDTRPCSIRSLTHLVYGVWGVRCDYSCYCRSGKRLAYISLRVRAHQARRVVARRGYVALRARVASSSLNTSFIRPACQYNYRVIHTSVDQRLSSNDDTRPFSAN